MQYVDVAGRALLITVFVLALVSKVSSRGAWSAFVRSTRAMAVIPDKLAPPAAAATAAAEAGVIVLAAVPVRWTGSAAFVLATGLLGCLTVAVVLVVGRGAAVPCRCFGATETPMGAPHVIRNLILLATALLGLAGSLVSGSFDPAFTVVVGLFGAVLGLLMARWDDLASLLRP
ncbi:MauE/DoxX family redox-associated membrane protein [Nonomuraea sp. NPDC050643]|uniref:MauE/DoxX family redox-associated membrane protein n=1 Tax=Nonomuraea sp. NPDC050643 TaxID=3155660 RepID=UPI0033E6102C